MIDWSTIFEAPPSSDDVLLLGVACVALLSIVTALTRVSRRKFARLQREIKLLSDRIKHLEAGEQRRFITELNMNSSSGTTAPSLAPAAEPARLQ